MTDLHVEVDRWRGEEEDVAASPPVSPANRLPSNVALSTPFPFLDEQANADYFQLQDQVEELVEQVTPTNELVTVRMAVMLLLVLLMVPGLLLTLWIAPNHPFRFLLGLMWIFLVLLFVGFVCFVQQDILRLERRGMSVVDHWTGALQREAQFFRDDWRQEQAWLLLMHQQDNYAPAEELPPRRRKAKSRIFRTLVQPLVPLLVRRRFRKHQQQAGDGVFKTTAEVELSNTPSSEEPSI